MAQTPFDATVKKVSMQRHLGSAGNGGSNAQTFSDAEGNQYVVKFKDNGQGLRVLVNEFVTNRLAHLLEIPVPRAVIVDIPQAVIDTTPAIGKDRKPASIATGPHFGCVLVKDCYKSLAIDLVPKLKNKAAAAGIFVLDVLSLNTDRKPEHLLVASPDFDQSGLYLCAIDHGHCFSGPNWNSKNISAMDDTNNLQAISGLIECVEGKDPFRAFLNRLSELDKPTIEKIVSAVPAEWGLVPEDAAALIAFLEKRKGKVEGLLNSSKAAFPKWSA